MNNTIKSNPNAAPWKEKDPRKIYNKQLNMLQSELTIREDELDDALKRYWDYHRKDDKPMILKTRLKVSDAQVERDIVKRKLNELLSSADAYVKESIEDEGFIDGKHSTPISAKRHIVDSNRERYIVRKYDNDTVADEVDESGCGTVTNINDLVDTIATNSDDRIYIDDYLLMDETTYEDDKDTAEKVLKSAHDDRLINAENKCILSMLMNSKDAIKVDINTLTAAINDNLCGESKKNAVILTNKDGFKKLDVIVNGVNLVKKINSDFIFNDKYVIREFPNGILPNNEDYAPVLIGDFENIIDVGIIDTIDKQYDEIMTFTIHDRSRVSIIPTLTTKSDSAYIICNI